MGRSSLISRRRAGTALFVVGAVGLSVVVLPGEAFAADLSWDGGASTPNWVDDANWSGDAEPANGDNATIGAFTVSVGATDIAEADTLTLNSGANLTVVTGGTLTVDQLLVTPGATLTVGGTLTVNGAVTISGGMTTVTGTLSASSTFAMSQGGVFVTGGDVLVGSAQVTIGALAIVEATSGGYFRAGVDVTVNGRLNIGASSEVDFTSAGSHTISGTGVVAGTAASADPVGLLRTAGEALTIGSGVVLSGHLSIGSTAGTYTLTNLGTLRANSTEGPLQIAEQVTVNNGGTVRVDSATSLNILRSPTNFTTGTGALTGGIWLVNGGVLRVDFGDVDATSNETAASVLRNEADLRFTGSGASFLSADPVSGSSTLSAIRTLSENAATGALTVGSGGVVIIDANTTNRGVVVAQPAGQLLFGDGSGGLRNYTGDDPTSRTTVLGSLTASRVSLTDSAVLEGNGPGVVVALTDGVVNTSGIVRPGNGFGTIGALQISGSYTQGPTGWFTLDLSGNAAGQYDTLNASGNATITGVISVTLTGGYNPPISSAHTVLEVGFGSSVTGTFPATFYPGLGGQKTWSTDYAPTSVTLRVHGPAPLVSGVSPPSGPPAGGAQVTVNGANFQPGATVRFDGVAAGNVVVVNTNTITAVTPPHPPGAVAVTVRNPDAQTGTHPGGYTYLPPGAPNSYGRTPGEGPTSGGTVVTITGTGFDSPAGPPTVTVDTTEVTPTSVSDTTIVFTTPAHSAPGNVPLFVTTPLGTTYVNGGFTYVGLGLSPDDGPTGGGTRVTISGFAFQPGAVVSFGGVPGTDVVVASSTVLEVTTPPHDPGPVDVRVLNPDGSAENIEHGFTYTSPGNYAFYSCDDEGLDSPFTDIASSFAHDHVICLYQRGVTAGVTSALYGPGLPTTREQMAVFLMRVWEFASGEPHTGPSAGAFTDVTTGMFGYDSISQLVALGVTSGTGPGTFTPQGPVTREQMAVFLVRFWEAATGATPMPTETSFTDIAGSYARTQIEQLVTLGITSGTSATTFSPFDVVTREQMAQFVSRLLTAVSGRPGPSSDTFAPAL